jgi:hypothetical protein
MEQGQNKELEDLRAKEGYLKTLNKVNCLGYHDTKQFANDKHYRH